MIRRPPRSTLFPTRRSSDLFVVDEKRPRGRKCSGKVRMFDGRTGNPFEQKITEHRSEEHTSELQSHSDLVCRLLLEKKKKIKTTTNSKCKTIVNSRRNLCIH